MSYEETKKRIEQRIKVSKEMLERLNKRYGTKLPEDETKEENLEDEEETKEKNLEDEVTKGAKKVAETAKGFVNGDEKTEQDFDKQKNIDSLMKSAAEHDEDNESSDSNIPENSDRKKGIVHFYGALDRNENYYGIIKGKDKVDYFAFQNCLGLNHIESGWLVEFDSFITDYNEHAAMNIEIIDKNPEKEKPEKENYAKPERHMGQIKFYGKEDKNGNKFGFIQQDGIDVLVHEFNIDSELAEKLDKGKNVSYELLEPRKGKYVAKNIELVEEEKEKLKNEEDINEDTEEILKRKTGEDIDYFNMLGGIKMPETPTPETPDSINDVLSQDTEELIAKAKQHYENANYEKALSFAVEAFKADVLNDDAYEIANELTSQFYHSKRSPEAHDNLELFVDLFRIRNATEKDRIISAGQASLNDKDYAAAQRHFTKIVDDKSKIDTDPYNQAKYGLRLARLESGIESIEQTSGKRRAFKYIIEKAEKSLTPYVFGALDVGEHVKDFETTPLLDATLMVAFFKKANDYAKKNNLTDESSKLALNHLRNGLVKKIKQDKEVMNSQTDLSPEQKDHYNTLNALYDSI